VNIINLFPTTNDLSTETPLEMIERIIPAVRHCDKIVVIMVDDNAGMWQTSFAKAGASNAEANLAIDLIKRHLMETIVA